MIDREQTIKFQAMEQAAPRLRQAFRALTGAHAAFQGAIGLRSVSVSDLLDDDSIEATFNGVRIKFQMLLVFGADRRPRARVVCIHCHCTFGKPVQAALGAFTFGPDGMTDLDPDAEGHFPRMDSDAAAIVLRYLEAAINANRTL
ncbi:hypothetical protein HF313_14230 [Massilia atriviolacea]|uniref:Uncharacterized protein n=1 Tax=Massilia atriviolacea TaxID=2495579 RepID=A0A430HQT7_9BURK|nr:hypothetical protein [Massilia atriviolacea]RSZ59882.1 hypothetical protein EJB06_06765 [Massilia atriviolacea]